MSNFKVIDDLPVYDLQSEMNKLLLSNSIEWYNNQICLNTTVDDLYNTSLGCGSLVYDWANSEIVKDNAGNEKIILKEYSKKLTESDFTELCLQFKHTLFEEVYNLLNTRFKLGRVRLMKSKPKSCLSWHVDNSVRLHFPIKTQNGCFMIIEDEVKHLKSNSWHLTNTICYHTAVNASMEDRIHLVVAVLDTNLF